MRSNVGFFRNSIIVLISQVPKVKIMFDWVCKIKPDIYFQSCDIFNAQYAVSRPKMLGGDPELGRKLFEVLIEKYPDHLLAKSLYLQYVLIPSGESELTEKLINSVKWESSEIYLSKSNLFNSIGKKRIDLVRKSINKLF